MKLVVVGLGSMGKRRIRLIYEYYPDIQIVGVDRRRDRCTETERVFNIKTYSDLDAVLKAEKPQGALICTDPISHSQLILKCLDSNLHVFSEINLLKDNYDEIINKAEEKKLKLFLSSTPLYRKEIQYIKRQIEGVKEKVHYRYHVGQYLPDWHPWEDYKDFFVRDKRTSGCREIFAIELPWIIKTFGKVAGLKAIKDKITSLGIEYNDSYIVLIEHETGHKGVLNVDIVSRKPVRSFEAYSESMHLFWNGTPDSLKRYDPHKKKLVRIFTYEKVKRDERYADNIIEDAYLEEISIFIKKVKDNVEQDIYTFKDDLYILDLIDKIEGIQL